MVRINAMALVAALALVAAPALVASGRTLHGDTSNGGDAGKRAPAADGGKFSPQGPGPPPPPGKVTCIPGDTCRQARLSCELDTLCNEFGQCPPSAPVPRDDDFVCRPQAGECDQEELCDGISLKCPPDAFQPAGTPCADINGDDSTCLGGKPEKALDPYEGAYSEAGPKGVYREPKSRFPKGRRLAAAAAGTSSRAPMPEFVVAVQANSADNSARRYKYNPRLCPLSNGCSGDDDDSGNCGGGGKGQGSKGL